MKTVTTHPALALGTKFTIAGVYEPDLRWWPRLRNRLLRRAPPMSNRLKVFRVTEVVGNTATVEDAR